MNRRTSTSIMSGYEKRPVVTITRRAGKVNYQSKTYRPGAASTQRLQHAVNRLLAQIYNRPEVAVTMIGETVFVDIEE